jgi:hypothetical protein
MKARVALGLVGVAVVAYFTGDLASKRAACRQIAAQLAVTAYQKSFALSCGENPMFAPSVCLKLQDEDARFGPVKSFRIEEIAQGPLGLPTVVTVSVSRGQSVRQEALVMHGFSYVTGLDDFEHR